jgi:uncharacterized protein YbbK (DUF523 family)
MDKRTEYIESLSAQMTEWNGQIDMLKDKAKSATPEVKLELNTAITNLQFKRDDAAVKLQKISTASDDEWEEMMTGAEHTLGEIRTMLRDTIMKLQ